MGIDKRLRKRSAPSVQVPHPEPVEKSRTAEETVKLLIRKSQLPVHLLPYCILSGNGKRHIDSVHSHEINLLLPSVMVPPAHGIVECTIVQIIPELVRGDPVHPLHGKRQSFRKFGTATAPADMISAVLPEVPVQRTGHAYTGVSFKHNPAVVRSVKGKPVLPVLLPGCHEDLKIIRMLSCDPLQQSLCSLFLFRRGVFRFQVRYRVSGRTADQKH